MTGFPFWRWRVGFEARLIARRLLRPYRQASARKGAETRKARG